MARRKPGEAFRKRRGMKKLIPTTVWLHVYNSGEPWKDKRGAPMVFSDAIDAHSAWYENQGARIVKVTLEEKTTRKRKK